jgi:hypothetical protein
MPKKDKLSKEERSQIAKDRWAKIRAAKAKTLAPPPGHVTKGDVMDDLGLQEPTPAPPPVEQEPTTPTGRDENGVPPIVGLGDGTVLPNGTFVPDHPPTNRQLTLDDLPIVHHPAPQLSPVRAPKPKRYQGPKEFSVALKAAENRLAKAITERSDIGKELAILQAKQWYLEKTEIPSLMGIINALKGSGNYAPPIPYDLSGGVPNAQAFQAPIDPQAALMAAMAAPPVSRAKGGAVQFSPDVVGSLEGPDDDDPDQFITGPQAGPGWIGG